MAQKTQITQLLVKNQSFRYKKKDGPGVGLSLKGLFVIPGLTGNLGYWAW